MAKRKTPRPPTPRRARATGGGSTRRSPSRSAAARTHSPKASSTTRKGGRPAATRKASTTKGKQRKRPVTKAGPVKAARKRTPVKAKTPHRAAPKRATAARRAPARPKAPATRRAARPEPEREETTFRMPPSSLNMDRRPSAARSGRAEMEEALAEHTETSPALTGGDVDADWESAYASGDEAPGGDMPTPDQGVVEEIGAALGVEYQDDEELKGAVKIEERDHHRWELDPASAEDYKERAKPERRGR